MQFHVWPGAHSQTYWNSHWASYLGFYAIRARVLPATAADAVCDGAADAADHPWPLFALRLRTPLLELRLPHDDDIVQLAEAGAGGILDERERSFMGPWSRLPDGEFERGFWRRQWAWRAEWTPAKWVLDLAVYPVGEPRRSGAPA